MEHAHMNDHWISLLEEFESYHPELADEVVDWYPIGRTTIVVILTDGRRLTYDLINNVTRFFYEPKKISNVDEEVWRKEFASRLRKMMYYRCISQERLSEETGISRITISKYVNGKATPNGYNLNRIAECLNCPVSEFADIRQ